MKSINLSIIAACTILGACATSAPPASDRPTDHGMTCAEIKAEFAEREGIKASEEKASQAAKVLMFVPILGVFALKSALSNGSQDDRLSTLAKLGKAKNCQ